MKVIDVGHEYDLDSYDGGEPMRLTFVKTNCQEVIRALINRVQYLQKQEECGENRIIIELLRRSLYQFEVRAAEQHGRLESLVNLPFGIENEPTCLTCGHVRCAGDHGVQDTATASALPRQEALARVAPNDPKSSQIGQKPPSET